VVSVHALAALTPLAGNGVRVVAPKGPGRGMTFGPTAARPRARRCTRRCRLDWLRLHGGTTMRIVRDVIATLIVAALALLYIDVVGGSSVGPVADARGVAATGLVLGLVACAIAGESVTVAKRGTWRAIAGVLVPMLVVTGIVTVIANNTTVLAVFMALLAVLWAGSTLHHLVTPGRTTITRAGATQA
jgi:hypothetical protein